MATLVRPVISEKNRYWIDKHRHYELKHFCLQYPEWKKAYESFDDSSVALSMIESMPTSNLPGDPVAKRAIKKAYLQERIRLIEDAAKAADQYLYDYILRAVTEGVSYTYLRSKMGIPCGRDMYYDRYRRFFWLLDNARK